MPHWERGHRCYGFWDDDFNRLGFIGLSLDKPTTYSWSVDNGNGTGGRFKTLTAAKSAVENYWNGKTTPAGQPKESE